MVHNGVDGNRNAFCGHASSRRNDYLLNYRFSVALASSEVIMKSNFWTNRLCWRSPTSMDWSIWTIWTLFLCWSHSHWRFSNQLHTLNQTNHISKFRPKKPLLTYSLADHHSENIRMGSAHSTFIATNEPNESNIVHIKSVSDTNSLNVPTRPLDQPEWPRRAIILLNEQYRPIYQALAKKNFYLNEKKNTLERQILRSLQMRSRCVPCKPAIKRFKLCLLIPMITHNIHFACD